MKKIIVLMLAAILLLSLCACGAEVPEGDGTQQNTAKPKTEETTVAGEETTGAAEETTEAVENTTEAETQESEQKALAAGCIGKDISELYALIGQPKSADYAPSCLVDGEDGMLYYDGFVVYTTRENGVEKVYYVE